MLCSEAPIRSPPIPPHISPSGVVLGALAGLAVGRSRVTTPRSSIGRGDRVCDIHTHASNRIAVWEGGYVVVLAFAESCETALIDRCESKKEGERSYTGAQTVSAVCPT
jgi:hypothetical protein